VLSCNLSEILTIFIAPLLGFAMPLLPIHILWINLVTDGLPGLALVAEPAEKNVMRRPPSPPKESLFAGGLALKILFTGGIITIGALAVQCWAVQQGYDKYSRVMIPVSSKPWYLPRFALCNWATPFLSAARISPYSRPSYLLTKACGGPSS